MRLTSVDSLKPIYGFDKNSHGVDVCPPSTKFHSAHFRCLCLIGIHPFSAVNHISFRSLFFPSPRVLFASFLFLLHLYQYIIALLTLDFPNLSQNIFFFSVPFKMRLRISIRGSVYLSVSWSFRPLFVRRSVRP